DEEMVDAIKNGGKFGDGELYERILDLAVDSNNRGADAALEASIFSDKVEVSDAFGIDYILRGGKRLRPAMTMLTEFALEDETSYKGAMVGTAQEIVHASSLEHDDDMDNDPLRREKLSSERINRALYGEGSWKQSVYEEFEGIPKKASDLFFQMEAELNDGQKRDIDMEDAELRESELEEYEEMIAGKTGALFSTGVDIILEDHLSGSVYTEQEKDEIRGLFED
ncbi:MAG: polyprenyl synthetase family protein, partial [Candidatus Aenigmatarchaeota archaeon]